MNLPTHDPPSAPQPGGGYETRDVNPLYVGLFGVGLIVMLGLVLLGLGWMFRRLETAARRADLPQSAVAARHTPPAPRLQVQPEADLVQFRQAEQRVLSSYGWLNRQEKSVHLPIDRAIDLLAERGFPEPEDQSAKQSPIQPAKQSPEQRPAQSEEPEL